MKVLYLAHSHKMGGSSVALINILSCVKSLGVEPIVYIPREGALSLVLKEMNIPYIVSPCGFHFAMYPEFRNVRDYILIILRVVRYVCTNIITSNHLRSVVKKNKIDIIHTNSSVCRIGQRVASELNIPHVWHIREYITKDHKSIPYKGLEYQRTLFNTKGNFNIAITNGVADFMNLSSENSSVIYDGVFPANIKSQQSTKKKYFLFVGSLQEGKAPHELLRAFIDSNISNYELWIAGDGHAIYTNKLKQIAEYSKCKSKIKFLGFREDRYELMASATALVVPSYFEGFGFITTEAMLNNSLVIGRDTAGTKEQFDNGFRECGQEIGLRYNTQKELIRIMQDVAKNGNEYYADTIAKANKVVRKLYSSEENARNIVDIYADILNHQ